MSTRLEIANNKQKLLVASSTEIFAPKKKSLQNYQQNSHTLSSRTMGTTLSPRIKKNSSAKTPGYAIKLSYDLFLSHFDAIL